MPRKGVRLCNRPFRRFYSLVSTAIEPSLDTCAHCGCKVFDGGHMGKIDGADMTFCCVNRAQSYKQDREPASGNSHRHRYPDGFI